MGKLQAKKSKVRADLAKLGILQREGENKFDKYKYFSEAQYKKLFTELFSKYGVELTMTTREVKTIDGTNSMPFGRQVVVQFTLKDTDTDEVEESVIVGEALDKGDKAIYKAYTGALKYFLANIFMVATGDDPETSGPEQTPPTKIEPHQVEIILTYYKGEDLDRLLEKHKITKIEDMEFAQAQNVVNGINRMIKELKQKQRLAAQEQQAIEPDPHEQR